MQPRISAQLGCCGAILGLVLHASNDHTPWTWRNVFRDIQITNDDLAVQLLVILTPERELATEEGEQKNTRSIDVCRRPTELDLLDDFRGHIGRSAAEQLDHLLVRNAGRKPEVDELDLAPFI